MIHHCHPPSPHWWRRIHVGDIYTCTAYLPKRSMFGAVILSATEQCGKQWIRDWFEPHHLGPGFAVWRPMGEKKTP